MNGVKLTGNWEELRELLSVGTFNKNVRRALSIATNINASVVRREIRDNIRSGTYASGRTPNAALTSAIKRSKKPLIDSGHLFRSVTARVIDWKSAEVGVLRGDPAARVAQLVHDGVEIEVTDRMRKMFAVLADASAGKLDPSRLQGRARELFERMPKGWKALRASTKVIKIPARPYIAEVVASESLNTQLGWNWMIAARRAIAGLPVTAAHMKTKG